MWKCGIVQAVHSVLKDHSAFILQNLKEPLTQQHIVTSAARYKNLTSHK